MILLIDNYDSFVYNLARYVGELGYAQKVVRNDKITLAEIRGLAPDAIILSPGPCAPDGAGICLELIRELSATTPILGVCLGHQCIGQAYGGRVARAERPVHGKTSLIHHDNQGIFTDLPDPLKVARYHSLIVQNPLPPVLQATAHTADGTVMALAHIERPVIGIQFHPESVLTDHGHRLLQNFFSLYIRKQQDRRYG